MRSPYEALNVLRSCATELAPHAVKLAIYGHMKGGLPATSMSDGRGSAEQPEPELDPTDRDLLATLDAIEHGLDQLATDALKLRKLQRDILYRQHRPAPKSKEFVRSELKAAADEYDRTHDLDVGTTWAKQQHEHDTDRPAKIEWCLSCLRIKNHLCPVANEKRGGKDGVLCWWCIRHRDGDKWPLIEHVRAHAEGRPVRMRAKQ